MKRFTDLKAGACKEGVFGTNTESIKCQFVINFPHNQIFMKNIKISSVISMGVGQDGFEWHPSGHPGAWCGGEDGGQDLLLLGIGR